MYTCFVRSLHILVAFIAGSQPQSLITFCPDDYCVSNPMTVGACGCLGIVALEHSVMNTVLIFYISLRMAFLAKFRAGDEIIPDAVESPHRMLGFRKI